VCVVVGHLSLSRSFSHFSSSCPLLRASVSFMVVRFQAVLPLPRVPPSVYVFVRTCVRARAAADAAVGLSKSCFHVPLCRTLLLLGRCRASTYSSSAPSAFFSATCVPSFISHRWASDGSVGPSSLIVGIFALFAGDRRACAIQGIVSSTTKRVRRPVLPPTLHSCGSLSKSSVLLLLLPTLSGSCSDSLSSSSFCVSSKKRVRRPLPRGVHRGWVSHLGAVWCSASPFRSTQCLLRAHGCMLCTLDIPYVCFAPRDVG